MIATFVIPQNSYRFYMTSFVSLWFLLLLWAPLQIFGKTCMGTDNGMNTIKSLTGPALHRVKREYENCTIVHGNLELVNWDITMLSEINDTNLNFLSTIEEVTGFVLISDNLIFNITLPKLKIIWGDKPYRMMTVTGRAHEYALLINGNAAQHLWLPSLRLVHNGKIGFMNNDYFCHWRTIDYRQLLGDNWKNRTVMDNNYKHCTADDYKCNGCTSCFGSEPWLCQQTYRNNCAEQCSSGMCFNASSPMFCCNSECAAGCFGPSDKDCHGCLKFRYNGKCVETCPPKERYNSNTRQYEFDPNGTFAYNRDCVSTCPDHTRIYKDGCVTKCLDGYYEDNNRFCQLCTGSCPKKCEIKGLVAEHNIRNFTNCTKVQGSIEITKESFTKYAHYDEDVKLTHFTYGINVSDLELLSNIEEVTDYIFIQTETYLKSLNFLRNLRRIDGRTLSTNKRYAALTIVGTSLEEIGMVKLREISSGTVVIMDNKKLCYADDLPWNKTISPGRAKVGSNANDEFCQTERKFCDASCDPLTGCWGPGPAMCFECKHYKLDGICVDSCIVAEGKYESSPKNCDYCHEHCLTCVGPSARNCTQCRNVKLDNECVDRCPNGTHYLDQATMTCVKCHEFCSPFGCTGGGKWIGKGGCNKCRFAVVDESNKITTCLQIISPEHLCTSILGVENYFWSTPSPHVAPYVSSGICKPCHNYCRNCSGYGIDEDNNGCYCRSNVMRVFNQETNGIFCDSKCPKEYYNISRGNGRPRECYPCHPDCDECTGASASECIQCKAHKVMNDDGKSFNCTEVCPPDRPFFGVSMICSNVDVAKLERQEIEQRKIIIASVAVVVLLLMAAILCAMIYYRRRAGLLAKMNPPDEIYEINPDAKPDMSQLRLITFDSELKIDEKPLGQGAFGVVYKGVWTRTDNKVKVPVAIKILTEYTPAAQQEMLDEACIMARINHPHLVRLIGVCLSNQQTMLVAPLMPLGNLLEFIHVNKHMIGSAALLRWCMQIASGMAHLEEHRLVHRDLAARNVLVQSPIHVRITDFGLAKMLDYGQDELLISEGKMPIKWLALECIQHKRFTHKSDVWAYGVTAWELLSFGEKPYKDKMLLQIRSLLENGERLPQPKCCTLDVYMTLIKCWVVDADSRPSFNDLFDIFKTFLKDPGRWLVIENDKLMRLPSYTPKEQCELARLMVDDPDVCNPDDYQDNSEEVSLPSTPTKPLMQQPPEARSRSTQRNRSTSSHRYQSDPLKMKYGPNRSEMSTDNDNYLIPDSVKSQNSSPSTTSSIGASLYTPVVTTANGSAGKHTYYNELPSPSKDSAVFTGSESGLAADNLEYMMPNSARSRNLPGRLAQIPSGREIVQTETVV